MRLLPFLALFAHKVLSIEFTGHILLHLPVERTTGRVGKAKEHACARVTHAGSDSPTGGKGHMVVELLLNISGEMQAKINNTLSSPPHLLSF